MEKLIRTWRTAVLFILIAVLLVVCFTRLYALQIVKGEAYAEESSNSIVSTIPLPAARGSVLDRNGIVLISNRISYNIVISRSVLLGTDDPNRVLLELVRVARDSGVEYADDFPVTIAGPFEYLTGTTDTQSRYLADYFKFFGLDENISASDLIIWLMDHYGIDSTTSITDARQIIGVRWSLEVRAITTAQPYVFARDVDTGFISIVLERDLPGVNVTTATTREYHTDRAPHVLGYIGLMSSEQYDRYKELGYAMDESVGQDGVELAFEEYLHGTAGYMTVTTDSSGTVTGVLERSDAHSGDNVYLTLDIGLQAAAEDALSSTISEINAARELENENRPEGEQLELATGGAAAVIDVSSSEVLALASSPTYDVSTISQHYAELLADPSNPLVNRATRQIYNPGSTFKMVTAYAGLSTGAISRYSEVTDTGQYTKYPDYMPKCWIWPGSHGSLNVVGALENSCNYFFYWLGDMIGVRALVHAAEQFGFGQKTGIEISEYAGTLASPEYKMESIGVDWYAADTLLSSIGQGDNKFTALQLANYVATIANDGDLHAATLLKCVKTADYSATVMTNEPKLLGTVERRDILPILREGMCAVASTGTASKAFQGYPIKVAAKTGTVQSDSTVANDGVFVCYAPADDPQIAIAVIVENGGSGAAIIGAAKQILDRYFENYFEDYNIEYEMALLQ